MIRFTKLVFITVLCMLTGGHAYKSGFTKESCDSMIPTEEPSTTEGTTANSGKDGATTAAASTKTHAPEASTEKQATESAPSTVAPTDDKDVTQNAPPSAGSPTEESSEASEDQKPSNTPDTSSDAPAADSPSEAPSEDSAPAESSEAPKASDSPSEAPSEEAPAASEAPSEENAAESPSDDSNAAPSEESPSENDKPPAEEESSPAPDEGDGETPDKAELSKAALESSEEESPYKILLGSTIYRRMRPIEITLCGAPFEAVMVQVRKDKERLGTFTDMPDALKSINCDPERTSAVTNKNSKPKVNLTVTWTAPENDQGPLVVTATFVNDEKYWLMIKSQEMTFSEFPTNLDDCAKAKSCIRLGSTGCHEDSCRYVLTYQLTKENASVEFVLGGTVKVNGYIGVAFVESSKPKEMTAMDTTACLRTSEDKVEVRHYIVGEGTMKPSAVEPENAKFEIIGDRLWCKFSLPVNPDSKEEMKFTEPLYQIYLQGELQFSNNTDEPPIVPMKGDHVLSKKSVSLSDLVDQRLPGNAAIPAASAVIFTTIFIFAMT